MAARKSAVCCSLAACPQSLVPTSVYRHTVKAVCSKTVLLWWQEGWCWWYRTWLPVRKLSPWHSNLDRTKPTLTSTQVWPSSLLVLPGEHTFCLTRTLICSYTSTPCAHLISVGQLKESWCGVDLAGTLFGIVFGHSSLWLSYFLTYFSHFGIIWTYVMVSVCRSRHPSGQLVGWLAVCPS